MSEGTEVVASGGVWAAVVAAFGVLLKVWSALPEEQKNKIINTVVDSFTKTFEAFFEKFHAWVKSDEANVSAAAEPVHD